MHALSGTAPARVVPSTVREQRRSMLVCRASQGLNSADKVLLAGLDKVLNQITSAIQRHESAKRKALNAGEVPVEVEQPGKLVKFSAASGLDKLVKEPVAGCTDKGKGLSAYLALPLDQYSLLDPKWITRPNPDAPDVFLLRVPLQDIMSINLTPEVYIRVEIDAQQSQVSFFADRFRLGDPRFDADFSLNMNATLRHKPVTDIGATLGAWGASLAALGAPRAPQGNTPSGAQPKALPAAAPSLPDWQTTGDDAMRAGDAATHTAFASAVSSMASGEEEPGTSRTGTAPYDSNPSGSSATSGFTLGSSDATGNDGGRNSANAAADGGASAAAGVLRCDVDLRFQVLMPHPLSVVPGPVLALAGGLLARLAVQSMLPGFLDLLSVDYGRWASGSGRSQAVGDLVATAPPPAAAGEENSSSHMGVGSKLGATVASVAAAVPGVAAAAADAVQQ